MKKFLLILCLFFNNPLIFASDNGGDFYKDKDYFGIGLKNVECPGPHFKSLYVSSKKTRRICVDKDSIIKLLNGGRARFLLVMNEGEKKHKVSYKSYWYQVDCEKGLFKKIYGYWVGNNNLGGSSVYVEPIPKYQIKESGWFEYLQDNDGLLSKNGDSFWIRTFDSLTPSKLMTYVSNEAKVFCKNM